MSEQHRWWYSFHLPWPPTTNTYYRQRHGRAILSRRGREFKEMAAYELLLQSKPPEIIQGPFRLELLLVPPDNRLRDLDNHCKALLDALVDGAVIADDCRGHLAQLQVTWSDRCCPGGYAEVAIGPVEGVDNDPETAD